MRAVPDGFVAEISITDRGGPPDGNWWISFRYPGVRIMWMAGATWHTDGGTVVIEPMAETRELHTGTTVPVTFAAIGPPGAPSGCLFDGARCHIVG